MDRPYQYLDVERHEKTCIVRLVHAQYDDTMLDQMGVELARLLDEDGCRSMILSLGPDEPDCLYSVFLAKLLSLKKRMELSGGQLLLADLGAHTRKILQVAGLEKYFRMFDDTDAALKYLNP